MENSKKQAIGKKGAVKVIRRILSYVLKYYKWPFILVLISVIIASIVSAVNTAFIQKLVDQFITPMLEDSSLIDSKMMELNKALIVVACMYLVGVIFTYLYNRVIAIVSQGTLKHIRDEMFEHMETLPLRFFDTHTHGDIMSFYTNDTDTLRQLLSMSLPNMLSCIVSIVFNVVAMFVLNWILALVVIFLTCFIFPITRLLVTKSARYFAAQQKNLGKITGYIEEYVDGQKVIKVFNHEQEAIDGFEQINEELCDTATKAAKYSNVLMPAANNLGNFDYIIVALVGGLIAINYPSLIGVGTIIAFINFTKALTNPIGQVAQQLSFVINALAGADRIFALMDVESEEDDGYVKLVNCNIDENGNISETNDKTMHWAWKYEHDGKVDYRLLKGDIVFENVKFSYNPNKVILNDINLYAKPGQKVAFVGATGAGKTTITNLINRFYDIQEGSIKYDGIDVKKIKKDDLRKSLGTVLQETNLFTGTIKDNIRYSKEDATDEEVIAAAKLANADSFIRMLPDGYDTFLTEGGNSLSQGQRQLISIARAALANPPVMILDEATSSIDTRTEELVQKGMDALMNGRTVFVIAHRLSTVKNSNVIIVLDHGNIIERGTHDQLIAQKGVYYQLYTGAFELE